MNPVPQPEGVASLSALLRDNDVLISAASPRGIEELMIAICPPEKLLEHAEVLAVKIKKAMVCKQAASVFFFAFPKTAVGPLKCTHVCKCIRLPQIPVSQA